MKGTLLFDDASLTGLCRRPRMAFDKIYLFDNHAILFWENLKDFSRLALFLARDYLNDIIFPNVKAFVFHFVPL